ncbi:MAG: hypothetical protein AB8B99_08055 [Phormidesmis sp.]
MKSSHPADPARSAATQYAASVPMTVYRELAAELRANKAVIDSLNSRNQQLLQQNQMLKHEIHNVVQATQQLGKAAGIAMPGGLTQGFPSSIAPDTLAKLVRDERSHPEQYDYYEQPDPALQPPMPVPISSVGATSAKENRGLRPIEQPSAVAPRVKEAIAKEPRAKKSLENRSAPMAKKVVKKVGTAPKNRGIDQNLEKIAKRQKAMRQAVARNEASQARPSSALQTLPRGKVQAPKKLFTEQVGEYRNAPDAEEAKEIGGIWLVLSIILIIVTAFGAGFLIMKPLLNDR